MKYALIPDDLSHSQRENGNALQERRSNSQIAATLWLLSIALTYFGTRWYYLSASLCSFPPGRVAAFDFNSPLYDTIDLHLDAIAPNATVWDDGSNIYRQQPSAEVDTAWHELEFHHDPILITESDLARLGLPAEGTVQWPHSNGSASRYVAAMDVFHLVHCVNVLRQGMWFDYYRNNETLNPLYWNHNTHCLDIIRQEIMCAGSLNVYRMIWLEGQDKPVPDFTINRQCRRWDDLVSWHDSHKIKERAWKEFWDQPKPDGIHEIPLPPEGRRLVEAKTAWVEKWHLGS